MNTIKEFILPAVLIIGIVVFDYRSRHLRRFVLKHAILTNFLWAGVLAGLNLHSGWRPALTIFLFFFVITSMAAIGRWFEHQRCGTPHLSEPSSQELS